MQKPRILIVAVFSVLIAGSAVAAYTFYEGGKKPSLEAIAVGRGDVHRAVSASGSVKAATDVTLAFERAGRISAVPAKVGDRVTVGQTLARLDAADLGAQLAQAQAARAAAQARLDALKKGARPEAVGMQDDQVAAAGTAVDQARATLADRIRDAYVKADDAVRGKADPLLVDPNGQAPHFSFFVADSALEQLVSEKRVTLGPDLADWQASVAAMSASSDLDAKAAEASVKLDEVRGFLDTLALALDKVGVSSNPGLAQATLDGWKTNVALARGNLTAAQSAVNAGRTALASAEAARTVAQSSRTLTVAGATAEDVAAQEAVVRQADAAVQAVEVQVAKTALTSPISGVVTRMDPKVGAIAAANAPAAAVISDGAYQIEVVVPEADIASVAKEAAAKVTLDAYGPAVTFDASVIAVDPSQAVAGQDGYKVTLAFDGVDPRIKDGMSADVAIDAGDRTNVVTVPRQAVIVRGSDAFVLEVDGARTEERKITLGLQGSDGTVEVLSGLSEGDHIASFGR